MRVKKEYIAISILTILILFFIHKYIGSDVLISSRTIYEKLNEDKLKISFDYENPPFYYSRDDKATGFLVEILNEIYKGKKELSFSKSSNYDLKIHSYIEGTENITIKSDPLFIGYGAIISKEVIDFEKIKKDEKIKIFVLKNSPYEYFIKSKNISNEVLLVENYDDLISKVLYENNSIGLIQEDVANYLIKNKYELKLNRFPEIIEVFVIVANREREDAINEINQGIKLLMSSGLYQKTKEKFITNYESDYKKFNKEFVKIQARLISKQIELYIKKNPDKNSTELKNDPHFREIAIQKVGDSGYTVLYNYETMINFMHHNIQYEGVDYNILKDKSPTFWEIAKQTINSSKSEADGFYDWIEPNGEIRKKYMYNIVIPVRTSDGVGLALATTAYIDDPFFTLSDKSSDHSIDDEEKFISELRKFYGEIDILFDTSKIKIGSPEKFAIEIIKRSKIENEEEFYKMFSLINGTWKTNLDYFRDNIGSKDVPGVMIYKGYELDSDKKKLMISLQKYLKDYAKSSEEIFENRYFTFEMGIDSIYPNEWIFGVNAEENFKDDLWYYIADPTHNKEKKAVWTPIYYDSILKKWMISLIHPIYYEEKFIGTTGGDISIEKILSILKNQKINNKGHSLIFDDKKNIVIHSLYIDEMRKSGKMEEVLEKIKISETNLEKTIKNIKNDEGVIYYNETDGSSKLLFYKKLKNVNLYYAFSIEKEQLFKERLELSIYKGEFSIKRTIYYLLFFVLLTIVLFIFFYYINKKNLFLGSKTKLILIIFILLIIIIFIFISFHQYYIIKKNQIENYKEVTRQSFLIKNKYLSKSLYDITFDLEEYSKFISGKNPKSQEVNMFIASFYDKNSPLSNSIFITDKEGEIINMYPYDNRMENKNIFEHYKINENNRKVFISGIVYTYEKEKCVAISVPLFYHGEYQGNIIYLINLNEFSNLFIKREDFLRNSKYYVIGKGDIIILSNDLEKIGLESSRMYQGINDKYINYEQNLKILDDYFYFRLLQDQNSVEEEVVKGISNYFHLSFFLFIFLLLFSFLISKKISSSLKKEIEEKTIELNKKVNELTKTKNALLNLMQDLEETNKQLKELDKAKSEFLNIVSHELKTPLTALIAHLEVIEDLKDNLNDEEKKSLEAIRRNAENLKMLISNILEIARMESGKFEITKKKADINKLIKEVCDELDIIAKQKNLKIILKLSKDIPEAYIDDVRIKEVMNNLITNAIKFTEKGKIEITTKLKGQYIEVSVKDTGVGIPKDKIKNLFQKFYQVDASISRRYGGTGLGLSITKKIIEAHGGEIEAYSEGENKGSEFKFKIRIK